jgi:hypothetical protein
VDARHHPRRSVQSLQLLCALGRQSMKFGLYTLQARTLAFCCCCTSCSRRRPLQLHHRQLASSRWPNSRYPCWPRCCWLWRPCTTLNDVRCSTRQQRCCLRSPLPRLLLCCRDRLWTLESCPKGQDERQTVDQAAGAQHGRRTAPLCHGTRFQASGRIPNQSNA